MRLVGRLLLIVVLVVFVFSCVSENQIQVCISPTFHNFEKLDLDRKKLKNLADKGFPRAEICYARILIKEHKYGEAFHYLRDALDKDNFLASIYIGKLYELENNKKQAAKFFFEALIHGYLNEEYFFNVDYITYNRLVLLEKLAKKYPKVYMYLGDYFMRNNLWDVALVYYQFAIRYGIKKAALKSAFAISKLGNDYIANSILFSLYKSGDSEGAIGLGDYFFNKAVKINTNICVYERQWSMEDVLRKKISLYKRKYSLYQQAALWYKKGGDYKHYFLAKEWANQFYLSLTSKKKIILVKVGKEKAKQLCEDGYLGYDFILFRDCRSPFCLGLKFFYRRFYSISVRSKRF